MPASHPAQLHELCQSAFNAADDEALAALYQEDAVFVTTPGSSLTGRAAIRKAYQSFWPMKPVMRQARLNFVGLLNPPYGAKFRAMLKILLR